MRDAGSLRGGSPRRPTRDSRGQPASGADLWKERDPQGARGHASPRRRRAKPVLPWEHTPTVTSTTDLAANARRKLFGAARRRNRAAAAGTAPRGAAAAPVTASRWRAAAAHGDSSQQTVDARRFAGPLPDVSWTRGARAPRTRPRTATAIVRNGGQRRELSEDRRRDDACGPPKHAERAPRNSPFSQSRGPEALSYEVTAAGVHLERSSELTSDARRARAADSGVEDALSLLADRCPFRARRTASRPSHAEVEDRARRAPGSTATRWARPMKRRRRGARRRRSVHRARPAMRAERAARPSSVGLARAAQRGVRALRGAAAVRCSLNARPIGLGRRGQRRPEDAYRTGAGRRSEAMSARNPPSAA